MDTADKLKSLSIDRSPPPADPAGRWRLIAIGAGAVALAAIVWALLPRSAAPPAAAGDATLQASSAVATTPAVAPAGPRGGLVASGYVVARRAATVSADIAGRLTSVLFEEGAEVEKGQVLAQLDDTLAQYDLRLQQGRLQSARASIEALKAEMIEAQAQRERADKLIASEAVSAASLEAAVSRIESLTARHASALADVKVAEVAVQRQTEFVERHRVRAPFAGVIIAKNAQAGEILSPASGGGEFTRTGVATLVDMTSLEVEVDVNEGQIADIRPGQNATIVLDAYTDWSIPGEVIAIIPTANRDRATIQVRVGFKERDPRVLPQMAAKVTFDRSETK
jgi:RND family efflux transporter MFP subunit